MSWVAAGLCLALLAWSVAVGVRLEPRLQDWYVARARGRVLRAVLVVAGVQLGVLAAWLVVWSAGWLLAGSGSHVRAAPVTVPAVLAAGPWSLLSLPAGGRYGQPGTATELRRRGARPGVARAISWTGAPFAFVQMGLVLAALVLTFAT